MSITVKLDLPEALAAKARAKGLLDPAHLTWLIERELDLEEPLRAYRELVEKMRAYPDDEPMTMDEIQAEVNAVRAERRQGRESGSCTNVLVSGLIWSGPSASLLDRGARRLIGLERQFLGSIGM